jgi:hypothetical protein
VSIFSQKASAGRRVHHSDQPKGRLIALLINNSFSELRSSQEHDALVAASEKKI